MSDTPFDAMKLIGGVEPTREQIQRVMSIAHSLGMSANDGMLPILIALDTYYDAFARMPREAARIAGEQLEKFERTAKQQEAAAVQKSQLVMTGVVEKLLNNMQPTVSQALDKVMGDVAKKEKWKWISGSLIAGSLIIAVVGMLAYFSGEQTGREAGYTQAKDEKAAAVWANTSDGQLAFQLAQTGYLNTIARCSAPGWKKEKGACYPEKASDGSQYGWVIPASK